MASLISVLRHQLPVHSPISADAIAAGLLAIVSPRRAAAGREHVTRFITERFDAHEVLLTDSGTTALRLAIAGAERSKPGSCTALPAYCCYDVATAADGADVPVVLYDLDPATLAPEMESLGRALDRGVSAVVVAHLYGQPADVEAVQRVAASAGAQVIEDAAQGIGARFGGAELGAAGSVSVLSLGRGKGWTGGTGGVLLAHDDRGAAIVAQAARELAEGPRGIADVARLAAQLVLGQPSLYGLPASLPFLRLGETIYRVPHAPRGASCASLGAASRTRRWIETESDVRRANGARLLAAARASRKVQTVEALHGASAGFLRLPVLRVAEGGTALGRAQRLGILPGYPRALCELPGFRQRVQNREDDFSGARDLAARLVTLPTHSRLSEGDIQALERWLTTR